MIIDRIEEQERYYPLHPDMELAFAFLAEAPDLEPGRYELENGLFATVSEGDTRQMDTVSLEAHKKYIDLQYCIAGGERMSWAHIQELNHEAGQLLSGTVDTAPCSFCKHPHLQPQLSQENILSVHSSMPVTLLILKTVQISMSLLLLHHRYC